MAPESTVFALPWWSKTKANDRSLYAAHLLKVRKLYDLKSRANQDAKMVCLLINELFLPLAEQDGQINLDQHKVDLCVSCGLEIPNLSADIENWFNVLTRPGSLVDAACILATNSNHVRQLIADGHLPATKVDNEWSVDPHDALCLAIAIEHEQSRL